MSNILDPVSGSQQIQTTTIVENFRAVQSAALFGIKGSETESLTLTLYGGMFAGALLAEQAVTLVDNATNYVEATTAGVVSANQAAFTVGRIKLYTFVIADNGGIDFENYTDYRSYSLSGNTELRGLTFTSDTGSTADSDPGAGLFKWNHATQASATVLYFDNSTADGISLTTFWASLSGAGFIFLQQADDPSKWQLWRYTAYPVDGTGYRKFTVTLQGISTNPIADDKAVLVLFDAPPINIVAQNVTVDGLLVLPDSAATDNRLLVGTPTDIAINGAAEPRAQVHGTTSAGSAHVIGRWSTGTAAALFAGVRSKSATIGTHAALVDADDILRIEAQGSDGTAFQVAAQILAEVDGSVSSGIVPGRVSVLTANASGTLTEVLRMDSAQKILAGQTAAITIGQSSKVQIAGNATTIGGLSVLRSSADASGPRIEMGKSRHATIGSNTIAQDGDELGSITGYGADGTNYDPAAQIVFEVDGTPGAGTDMPGRVRVLTSTNGSATLTERMRVDNAGNVVINTAAIATNATDGFLYVPTCAGTPTGTPTAYTGRAPIVINTTNNKLYFYSGGAWRDAGP